MTVTPRPAEGAGFVSIGSTSVPRIGYGMGSLARAVASGDLATEDATALLHRAQELGVTFYDTAQFYNNGLANELLAGAFGSTREKVQYATKVGARPVSGPVPMTAAQQPSELRAAVEDNLRALRTDHLDVVYLRRMDMTPGLVITDPEQQVPLEDQLAELIRLREAGTVGAIGISHVSQAQMQAALPAGIAAVSNIYNMVDRKDEAMLKVAESHGIVWSPYFPLGGGGWAGLPKVVDESLVQQTATSLDVTPNQVGLAWLLAHSPQTLVIAGTATLAHLEENVASAEVQLPAETLSALDAIAAESQR